MVKAETIIIALLKEMVGAEPEILMYKKLKCRLIYKISMFGNGRYFKL